jgi:TorA maturation chaperone TorD
MDEELQTARTRALVYRFLAGSFLAEPTGERVEALMSDRALGALREILPPEVFSALERAAGAGEDLDRDIRPDFQGLFMVPAGQYTTPYGSVYMDRVQTAEGMKPGLLMGPSTHRAMRFYRVAGLSPSPGYRDLPDFVGCELDFMRLLCEREAELLSEGGASGPALGACRGLQRRFLGEQMVPWIPELCARVREKARTHFFRAVASLTEFFVRADFESLSTEVR